MRLGLRPETAFRGLGFTAEDLGIDGFRPSVAQSGAAVLRLLRLVDRPCLGLDLGASATVSAWGMVGLAMLLSSHAQALIDLGIEFQQSAGRLVLLSRDASFTSVCLVAEPVFAQRQVDGFLLDETLASLTQICRQAVGAHFHPRQVELVMDRPPHAAAYESFFRCAVHFGREQNRLHFPGEAYAVASGDTTLMAEARRCLTQGAARVHPVQSDLEIAVQQRIRRTLAEPVSLAGIADSLHLSERTLRRRLDGLGLSYADMLDAQRRTRALALLVHSSRALLDVARECGFADERTLARAVKRWTGQTPVKVRKQALLSCTDPGGAARREAQPACSDVEPCN